MHQRKRAIILWTIVAAAATQFLGSILIALAAFKTIISPQFIECGIGIWRFTLIAIPLTALALGWCGWLPGTRLPEGGTSKTTNILITFTILFAMVFAFEAWIALKPSPQKPTIAIGLVGYTNSAAGVLCANIAFTNLSPSTVYIYRPMIQIASTNAPAGLTYYSQGGLSSWHALIARGDSASVTLPLPAQEGSWRLTALVYPNRGRLQNAIERVVSVSCLCLDSTPRFVPRFMRLPYNISGGWTTNL
jgi:hypothetical protein